MRLQTKRTDICRIFVSCFISILVFFTFSDGQTISTQKTEELKPLSVCELLKNKKKFNGKEVMIKGIFKLAAETSVLVVEEDCPFYDSITIGTSDNFASVNSSEMQRKFEEATDLFGAIQNNQLGLDKNKSFQWFFTSRGGYKRYFSLIQEKEGLDT